jgi:signal transduction histidine kinase
VNELLQAARVRAGQVELHPEPLDVRAVADEVVRGLEPIARERSLRSSAVLSRTWSPTR